MPRIIVQKPFLLGRTLINGTNLVSKSPNTFIKFNPHIKRQYSNYQYQRFNNQNGRSFSQLLFDPVGRKYLAIIFGGGSLFYFTHREEAPMSGRKRFIWIPRWLELKIGNHTYKTIIRETGNAILPEDHPMTKKVERIFTKIVEAAYKDPEVDKSLLDGIQWRIHVVNDPTQPPNAFVLPGGKVFVFGSILGICKNEDGLATVLSHEFAHQLARHTSENLSKAPIYAFISLLIYSVIGVNGLDNLLTDGLLRMPASRQMETEADYIGLMIMARACFNPSEAINLWKRMSEFEQKSHMNGRTLEFLSTHPASERRIHNMENWMAQANGIREESDCGSVNNYYRGFQDSLFGSSLPSIPIPSSPFPGF
ncbi:similar to Saccharomyces cerevisiae YKR087C OMA1 Metalloendopeptidase of the mitochondrial inner membrane, involved in turnover of membrane-embedded proteins [Maudiozyma barnettii]|uniref:Similar to Saccharomyces cerevisiae YKR087C OMA1 Metalloendopeptidase of the mitochondrial inner membrane, involved in turnover of membrane-embedded proteins n=1 Tax=Maudiozyma barnettii TaxID=61262 RepID=A0A8H2VIH4_9SACH|nr:metalloendopeptidase [Kazachstania barnettii]CAB4256041.1 similar to Saccharomyces cerevisiae YKR087C OMA1 Metalloendopeptidase of the mitochondrial inner membrane, involved in turnover of membrane-embedded proteins [Kazachstania barnettii]CAD1784649.1 similar to Saccharomyces cerevisiae YKR087C OMA1 Metalloendopeptidase of the mitochondrial inner membrane, involved in turnover of membrane-embedded proteins [Kazachstania barnettii]